MIQVKGDKSVIQAIPLKQSMFQGIATGESTTGYQVLILGADGDLTVTFQNTESLSLSSLLAGTAFALDESVASVTSTASILMS